MKHLRAASALAAIAWIAMLAAGIGTKTVLANGIGDLYAAVPAGLVELHVASAKVVELLDFTPAPAGLAFSNDGKTLWAARGLTSITPVDIASISLSPPVDLPGRATAVAVPQGSAVVVAIEGRTSLSVLQPMTGVLSTTRALPGVADILAADRREPMAVAARRGARWIAVIDPIGGSVHAVELGAAVVGLAVDRGGDAAWAVTTAPNRLLRIQLRDPKVTDHFDLALAPAGVVSTSSGPVFSAGGYLWAGGVSVRRLGTTEADFAGLAVSDDGRILYAAHGLAVTAYDLNGRPLREIDLGDGQSALQLAAVPAPPSLGSGPGAASASGPAGGAPGSSGGPGASDHSPTAPATSTNPIDALVRQPLFLPAVILVALIAAASLLLRRPRRAGHRGS